MTASDVRWLIRHLGREKYTGHCGEENAEIRARNDHNDRIDRITAALSSALTPAPSEAVQ
jgi:hypothetical protein